MPAQSSRRLAILSFRTPLQRTWVLVLAPLAFGPPTACQGSDRALDEQMRADLLAASQAPSTRQQYMSPAKLGYPAGSMPVPGYQGYAPVAGGYPQPYATGYPQPVMYPAPALQPTRVVYAPQPAPARRTGAGGGTGSGTAGNGTGGEGLRNTQKGAIYGAATGAAIGVISSRDRAKGAAVGALGGAVLGGLIGHQVRTPR